MQFKKIFFYISILSASHSSVAMEPPQVPAEELTPQDTHLTQQIRKRIPHKEPLEEADISPAREADKAPGEPAPSEAPVQPVSLAVQIASSQALQPTESAHIEPAVKQSPSDASRAFPHDYYDEDELAARHRAKGKDPAPRIELAIPQHAEDEPATAAQAVDRTSRPANIKEGQERLRKCDLVFPVCRAPKRTAIMQLQAAQPEDQLEPKYLIQALKRQLAGAQQCTKRLFPHISSHTNKIGQIYNALSDAYKFFIIDTIIRSIQFLKTQEAAVELEQIGIRFNELIKPHLSAEFNTNLSELYYIDAQLADLARNPGDPAKIRDILHIIYDKLHHIIINFNEMSDETIGEELHRALSDLNDFGERFGEFIGAKTPEQELLENLPHAQTSINRIISRINELSQDRLTTTSLVNVPDSDLHHFIATFLPDLHQLESFQMAVICNDISTSIGSAKTSPEILQQICLKFNELLDCSKKQATSEQQKSINKSYLQPELLISLDRIELNKLLSKRILDLNKYAQKFHQYVRQITHPDTQHISDIQVSSERIQTFEKMKRAFENILQKDSPYADGRTIINKLFDETREITNQHRESILQANQTIDALRMYLTTFLHQEDIALEKCDLNLVKEIEAFLATTRLSLSDAHNKIAQLTDEINATADDIEHMRCTLESIIEKEKSIRVLSQSQIATDGSVHQLEEPKHSILALLKTTTKKVTATVINYVVDYAQTKAQTQEEKILRAELVRTQEALENAMSRLDLLVQRLRNTAKVEFVTMQNLQTLCTILDSHKNPQFRLFDQDRIEESMFKDLLKANFFKPVHHLLHNVSEISLYYLPEIPVVSYLKSYLKDTIKRLAPSADRELREIEERTPNYPFAGKIFFGSIDLFKKYQKYFKMIKPKYQDDQRQLDALQEELETFDDRYTLWLINTQNPQYILYDIAARTRLNTGRFTPLIKELTRGVEQHVLGGAYGKTENKHDPEELHKYPDYKVDAHGKIMYKVKYELDQQGKTIPITKPISIRKFVMHACEHHEQPGERYTDLMHMVSDAIPLEHAWILLQIPSCAVRIIENILRVASQKAYPEEWLDESPLPATQEIQQPTANIDEPAKPMTSTSLTNFIWNGLKKISDWSLRNICVLGKKMQQGAIYLHQSINIITAPFVDSLPYKIVTTTATKTTSYVQPKIHSLQVHSCRKVRSFLYYLAAKQMRLLESHVRQKKPLSDQLSDVKAQIKRHSAHGLVNWLFAEGAYNAAEIRAFARQYDTIGRIDPIIQIDPLTGNPKVRIAHATDIPVNPLTRTQPVQLEASIKHYELRKMLGSLIEGWETQALEQHT